MKTDLRALKMFQPASTERLWIRAGEGRMMMQGEGEEVVVVKVDDTLVLTITCPSSPGSLAATFTDGEVLH